MLPTWGGDVTVTTAVQAMSSKPADADSVV